MLDLREFVIRPLPDGADIRRRDNRHLVYPASFRHGRFRPRASVEMQRDGIGKRRCPNTVFRIRSEEGAR